MRWINTFRKVRDSSAVVLSQFDDLLKQGLYCFHLGHTGKSMSTTILSSPVSHVMYSVCQPLVQVLNGYSTVLETSATIAGGLSMKRPFKT
jgi:hypothetical protein